MTTPTAPARQANGTVNESEPAAPEPSVLYEIIRTPTGWQVDEDGRGLGDYETEAQALAAAGQAAMALIDAGGRAEISYGPVLRGKRS